MKLLRYSILRRISQCLYGATYRIMYQLSEVAIEVPI